MKENKEIISNAAPGKAVMLKDKVYENDKYRVVFGGVDSFLLFTILILLAYGLVMVFSASYADAAIRQGDSYYFIKKQCMWVFLGLLAMAIATRPRPEHYKMLAVPAYFVACALLVAVLVFGSSGGGAQRWIAITPSIRFQPSEIAKFALILALAWYYSKFHNEAFDRKNIKRANIYGTIVPIGIIGLVCVLVLFEKHLSGIIIIGSIGLMVMFVSGIRLRLLSVMCLLGGAGVTAFALLVDYTRRRIDIWFHPELYPQDGGWQTLQGLRAIGSGGFFGLGLGNSRQKFSYVSQPQNDFIYTIICEELGFIGAISVLVLFGLLVWRGFVIAMRAPDRFSQLVAIGITGKVALQVLLNIAVVTNTLPNTGISLPFISYGGSAMLVQLVEMGALLSISRFTLEKK